MSIAISAERQDGGGHSVVIDRDPDLCPLCHRHITPRRSSAIITEAYHEGPLQITFRCTNPKCDRLFIGYYKQELMEGKGPVGPYLLRALAPTTPMLETFSDHIRKVSPTFIEIYNQAIASAAHGFTQLTGMGLRKALEFLIKDFLIARRPNDAGSIKTTMLGTCINNYVDDPRIKSVAARATWLGNDETHYVRKFADRDIEDMKRLVKLTVNWIESVLLTEEYEASMSKQGAAVTPAGGAKP